MRNFTDAIKDGLKYNPSSAYVRIFNARIFLWTRICPVNADPEIYIQGRAKTAKILFTVALASELQTKHVDSVSLHPGCKGFPKIPRSGHHPDEAAAIKTNLQTYVTQEMRKEALKAIETNTGRKHIFY